MEMEGGRGLSELLRNSSDELFLKTLMENPIGTSAPSMEMLGLRNISQSFRGDSEELFNSWLMNGEIPGYSSVTNAHRTRQASRRLLSEPTLSQQNGVALQKRHSSEILFQQSSNRPQEPSNECTQHSLRNAAEKGMEASTLYLAKAWFNSSQPMTRSRSSELRKYAAMQTFQVPTEVPHITSGQDMNGMKQEFNQSSNFCGISNSEVPHQLQSYLSPSNSSTSAFNIHPVANGDTVSSVVNMLKGALERKKLGNQMDNEIVEERSFTFYNSQEIPANISSTLGAGDTFVTEPAQNFGSFPYHRQNGSDLMSLLGLNVEGPNAQANQIQMATMSREPSQSESSAAAPALSAGCDGPANSGQTFSVCESSRKNIGNGTSGHASQTKGAEYRERILDNNLKGDRKKATIVRMGSVSSGGSVDKGDPTKKRRVERSRKMQEAKERNSTPSIPSDMQSVLKRCENLEKEVRSLKLNLSFMNRKDSEQTKQIEELQKQNEDLSLEKERLLDEIERIISDSGKM